MTQKYRGEVKPVTDADATKYERDFEAVVAPVRVKLDGFSSGINGKNFPGQELGPTNYRVNPKKLPPNSHGYTFKQMQAVVAGWVRDKLISGGATVIETVRYGGEKRGDQPDVAWIVCAEAVSVEGEVLVLNRVVGYWYAGLNSCSFRLLDGCFVLVRELLPTQP